jgi:hypothetical protein
LYSFLTIDETITCFESNSTGKYLIAGGLSKTGTGCISLVEVSPQLPVKQTMQLVSADTRKDKPKEKKKDKEVEADPALMQIDLIMRVDDQDNFIVASHEFIFVVKIVGLEMENRFRMKHGHQSKIWVMDRPRAYLRHDGDGWEPVQCG